MRLILALVDCNDFYASCERSFNASIQGRPVLVMSNNDGCVVARSRDIKHLIAMGTPVFQCRELIAKYDIALFSSNYSLYADLSARVMKTLAEFSPQPIEVYSIDEAFLDASHIDDEHLLNYGQQIRGRVRQYTGIPVSVGLATTKTLAKIANEVAKKRPELRGVVSLVSASEREIDELLSQISVDDVWMIGPRYASFLRYHNIYTARDFKDAHTPWVRKHLTVVGERTQRELKGMACLPLEPQAKPKKGIMRARSFSRDIDTLEELQEAVATYTARAAEQLRAQGSAAASITVFIRSGDFHKNAPQYEHSASRTLLFPTAFTPELIRAAKELVKSIYQQGMHFRKAGVFLSRVKPQAVIQADLFGTFSFAVHDRQLRLMQVIDQINTTWGKDTIFLGSQGITRSWQMKQSRRSPRYTTRWSELLEVRAQ